jgi:hypothetical protein
MSDSCQDCPAGDGRRVYRPNSPYADNEGFVSYCVVLQQEGVCARKLLEHTLEAEAALAVELSAGRLFLPWPMAGRMGARERWYAGI